MFVIIESGGKQYKVGLDGKARVPKLPVGAGGEMTFDKVLLKSDENGVQVGAPYISGATIQARVLGHGREKKKIVFRYHSKTRYRKKKGHRQDFTEVEVTRI